MEKTLEEVAIFTKGKGISKSDIAENGKLPCIRYGELYTHYNETISDIKSHTNLDPNDLILSEVNDVIIPASGETQIDIATASCVLGDGIALGGDLNIIKTNINGVFLAYCLNSAKKRDIAQIAQGISVVHLYSNQLKSLIVNIPNPQEQQKIADCLSSFDALITTQTQKLQALQQHKKGLMQNLFPAEGKTTPKLRFPEFVDVGEWEEKKLGDIGKIITGKTPSTKNDNLWNGDILFITPTDIFKNNKYQLNTQRTITRQENTRVLPIGSIIYTCIASIGKIAITTSPSITNQQINSVVTKNNIASEYIYYSLIYLTPWIKSIPATSTLSIINKSEFSNITIKIPKLKEQQKIADCLSSLDALITTQTQKIEALQQHKKGLMQQLFPATDEVDI